MRQVIPPGPRVGLVGVLALLAALDRGGGLGAAGWVVGLACGVALCACCSAPGSSAPRAALLPADRVTLTRAVLACGVAALVADAVGGSARAPAVPTGLLVALASVALVLDAVDGRVARRTGDRAPPRRPLRHGDRRLPHPRPQRARRPRPRAGGCSASGRPATSCCSSPRARVGAVAARAGPGTAVAQGRRGLPGHRPHGGRRAASCPPAVATARRRRRAGPARRLVRHRGRDAAAAVASRAGRRGPRPPWPGPRRADAPSTRACCRDRAGHGTPRQRRRVAGDARRPRPHRARRPARLGRARRAEPGGRLVADAARAAAGPGRGPAPRRRAPRPARRGRAVVRDRRRARRSGCSSSCGSSTRPSSRRSTGRSTRSPTGAMSAPPRTSSATRPVP